MMMVSQKALQVGKRLQVQMKKNIFHAFDPILMIGFYRHLNLSVTQMGPTRALPCSYYHSSWKCQKLCSKIGITAFGQISLTQLGCGMLTSYCSVINYPLETYKTEDVAGKIEVELLRSIEPPGMLYTEYARVLSKKARSLDFVYD